MRSVEQGCSTCRCSSGKREYIHQFALDLLGADRAKRICKESSESCRGPVLGLSTSDVQPSSQNPLSTPMNTRDVICDYIASGVTIAKIVLGMPLFGQSFAATDGLGKPHSGVGSGNWEPGIYDFKSLPLAGAEERTDPSTGSCYSYDVVKREVVSYDNVPVAQQKAAFIQDMKLGGAVWWEGSADKPGSASLIQNVAEILGASDGPGLDHSPNQLAYPDSAYENMRAGVPDYDCISLSTRSPVSIATTSGTPIVSSQILESESMDSAIIASSSPMVIDSELQMHTPFSIMNPDSSAVPELPETDDEALAGKPPNVNSSSEINRPSCVLANPPGRC
ncbi:uncharacterized protein RAG0_17114 [Rhynchosporium agropyri]|uniref:chitinase n=1 Tax=Rhynchosporium agropyri TaxID=914238 RepID=A0A1E1LSZ5_9HELO|nr:uncharacterized protein RAG0_17114 [Rhynchosporium agropyri]